MWRAEDFSYTMTTMPHAAPGQSTFDTRLQTSQLDRVASCAHAAAEPADNYAGLTIG
jgi:p-hydroxybenzoate 3-monooxygenase